MFGLNLSSGIGGHGCAPTAIAAWLNRYIRTLNGVNQSGAFNTPISVATGDTVSIPFTYPAGGVARNLTEQVLFDAANLLQLTSCTATIDGASVASGASMAAYIDGKIHTIVLTATAPFTMTYLGQSGVGTNFYAGAVFDVTHTVAATGAVLSYVIDNASLVYTQARGYTLGTEKILDSGFDVGVSNWLPGSLAAGISLESNTGRVSHTGTNFGSRYQAFTTEIGKQYVLAGDFLGGTSRGWLIKSDSSSYATNRVDAISDSAVPIHGEVLFTATATTTYIHILVGVSGYSDYDNITVREAPASITWTNLTTAAIQFAKYNHLLRRWESTTTADVWEYA